MCTIDEDESKFKKPIQKALLNELEYEFKRKKVKYVYTGSSVYLPKIAKQKYGDIDICMEKSIRAELIIANLIKNNIDNQFLLFKNGKIFDISKLVELSNAEKDAYDFNSGDMSIDKDNASYEEDSKQSANSKPSFTAYRIVSLKENILSINIIMLHSKILYKAYVFATKNTVNHIDKKTRIERFKRLRDYYLENKGEIATPVEDIQKVPPPFIGDDEDL